MLMLLAFLYHQDKNSGIRVCMKMELAMWLSTLSIKTVKVIAGCESLRKLNKIFSFQCGYKLRWYIFDSLLTQRVYSTLISWDSKKFSVYHSKLGNPWPRKIEYLSPFEMFLVQKFFETLFLRSIMSASIIWRRLKDTWNKTNKTVGLLLKLQNTLPRPALFTIHKYFRSHFDYADALLCSDVSTKKK